MKNLNTKLLSDEANALQEKLQSKVIAQDRAIKQFVTAVQSFRSGLNTPGKPLGVFLFLGATGVGKTEVVRQFCQAMFGNPDAMLKVDCGELKKEQRAKKLRTRGIKGRVMTLEQHRRKLYYADGRERPCTYCGGPVTLTGSGIDRKDSSINYTVENSVACCGDCNNWKNQHHTYQETRDYFAPQRRAA